MHLCPKIDADFMSTVILVVSASGILLFKAAYKEDFDTPNARKICTGLFISAAVAIFWLLFSIVVPDPWGDPRLISVSSQMVSVSVASSFENISVNVEVHQRTGAAVLMCQRSAWH